MTAYHLFTWCAWIQDTGSNIDELFKQLGLNTGRIFSKISPKRVPQAIWPTHTSDKAFLRGTPLCELKNAPARTRTCVVTAVNNSTIRKGSLSLWAEDDGQACCIVFDSSCKGVHVKGSLFQGVSCWEDAAYNVCIGSTM